jgi:hypothetical protein
MVTKTANFIDEQNKLAVMLKASTHPPRIAIIEHMIKARGGIGSFLH